MKKSIAIQKIIPIFLLVSLSWSCSSNLDFNQTSDLVLKPVIEANLTYFDIPAADFVTDGVETIEADEMQNFDVFRDPFLRDNLKQVTFFFEITNTINRIYDVNFVLYDKEDNVVYRIKLNVLASDGTPQIVSRTVMFSEDELVLLKQTEKMEFEIKMMPGTPLTENSTGSLKLKSSATLYMDIK
ncbi:hypothetical protein [Flavobacterium sp. 7A]|uniref:hypothetical protein n=1 Tax=Flavobacterium sp. 7A TaxID=2940571 RepID=UPI002226E714|nr:hypothetical protein [Flavobacterium sp. 7A]MCW2120406.1 hypothetical protein [Flavobacterium sp. 7A]